MKFRPAYEDKIEAAATAAFVKWASSRPDLSDEDIKKAHKRARDAASATWVAGIGHNKWVGEILRKLGKNPR